jgi:hypothetical protein
VGAEFEPSPKFFDVNGHAIRHRSEQQQVKAAPDHDHFSSPLELESLKNGSQQRDTEQCQESIHLGGQPLPLRREQDCRQQTESRGKDESNTGPGQESDWRLTLPDLLREGLTVSLDKEFAESKEAIVVSGPMTLVESCHEIDNGLHSISLKRCAN